MSVNTRESNLAVTQSYVIDHECAYADRLIKMSQGMGDRGIQAYQLSYLVEELQTLHTQAENCPTTHIDSSPTVTWADWVHDTVV